MLNKGILLALVLLTASILVISVSCWGTPLMDIIVENQTEYDLTIFIKDWREGDVSPGDKIIVRVSYDTGEYHIIARNTQGEIVFSEILSRQGMQKIESRVYKVIIK